MSENEDWYDKIVQALKALPYSEEPITAEACDEPSYYNSNDLSPLLSFKQGLLSEEEYQGFLKGNIIKYMLVMIKKVMVVWIWINALITIII